MAINYCSTRSQRRQSAKLSLQSSELGLPHPLSRRQVCPPPFGPGERGWESPNFDERTYTVVIYIYKYFVFSSYLFYEGKGES
jgi:hypothetical protein